LSALLDTTKEAALQESETYGYFCHFWFGAECRQNQCPLTQQHVPKKLFSISLLKNKKKLLKLVMI